MRGLTTMALLTLLVNLVAAQTAPATATRITLAELEQLALRYNPTTQAAEADIEAARSRTQQAGAWPNPVIGYSGEEITFDDREKRGAHGFFVEQTIPLGGKLKLSRDVLQKTMVQAEAVRDLQRLRILSSVRQTFYTVLLTERRIDVQEKLATLASEAVGVTAQLFNVGAADRPDFLEIEIEARRMQLQLNRTRNELVAARAQLAALAGARDIAVRPLAGSIDAAIPELQRDEIMRTLLEQSPELRAARADLERARAMTARASRETSPDLFLRGGSMYNRERGDVRRQPIGWEGAVEAGVRVPLFNRHTGGVASARADETRAQADVARLELALQARAESEFASYLTALRASEAYRSDLLPRAEEAYRLYLTRYRQMAAAYPQVLVAQRTFFELSVEYLEHLEQAWRSAMRLQGFVAGGGLDPPARSGEASEAMLAGGGER
jgi:cobalt-zinc-cadmium efflux system outer membrane protein